MTVVRSETRVLVSHDPLSNPPPRGPTTSPPKMLVRRRMKVDFPHPESAATPIMMGVWPASRAMLRAELESTLVRNLGLKAEGENAAAVAKRALTQMNFMVDIIDSIGIVRKEKEECH